MARQITLSFPVDDDDPIDAAALSIAFDRWVQDEIGVEVDSDVIEGEALPFSLDETVTLIRAGAELYESIGDPADVLSAHQKSLLERAHDEVVDDVTVTDGEVDVCKHCATAIEYLDDGWYAPVDGQAVAACPSNEPDGVHEPMGDL